MRLAGLEIVSVMFYRLRAGAAQSEWGRQSATIDAQLRLMAEDALIGRRSLGVKATDRE